MFGKFATAALLCLAATATASAADPISYSTSANQQLPVAEPAAGYDWNGFYAGVMGAAQKSPAGGDQFGIGIDAGINTTYNFVLAGAEIAVIGLGGGAGTTTYAQALGRLGLLVGDNALVYGAAGYGIDAGAFAQSDALVGGGLEYAITDSLSLKAQYLHGFPVTGANPKDQITLGAQFHF